MLKTLMTLVKGSAAAAEEEFMDRNALLIVDQQIREAAAAVERSKRALAVAIAQDDAEARRLATAEARLADLEERAVAALQGGREDLATEAAEAIAALEADRDAIREARTAFSRETAELRRTVSDAARRLAALERGRNIARAAEAVRRLRGEGSFLQAGPRTALAEAEATLKRLRERQIQDAVADAAYAVVEEAASSSVADKLEAAGFGPRTKPSASRVMERLRQKAEAPAPSAA